MLVIVLNGVSSIKNVTNVETNFLKRKSNGKIFKILSTKILKLTSMKSKCFLE